ncbi:hypothetical protein CYMTET_54295 [Cymbomonas tetramitiformis]|uniref:Uncharacterized protein n=1 Tax=Cymbomonas tetramitiformis TaxID=36881 RepID=A0AAE0BF70_9CHLO|nr:hypothetical protein CYMTET_54295 [Cymbomonas tetramitiformis]
MESQQQVSLSLPEFRRLVISQLDEASARKEEGNTLFKSAQVDEAFDKYHEVVQSVKGILAVPALGRPDMVDLKKKVDLMHLAVNLNLAACSLKEKRHEEAMEYCREVLTVDDRNVKALFRRAQALSQLSRSGEAIEVLNKARKLDPQNRDLEVLLKQITSEERKRVEQEKKRFGGMFEWGSYQAQRDTALSGEQRLQAKERRELEALVADSADAAEAGLLYRWVSNGVAPLDQQERRQLALLVRRVAALGRLDSAEHREKFAAHGLGAAFRLEEEEMEQDQLSQWKEQQKLQEVKRITLKAQNRQTLTEEEAATVQSFKREEIDRLSRKQAD